MLYRFTTKSIQTLFRNMSTSSRTVPYGTVSPPVHRGLAVLDKSLFSIELPVLAARVLAPETTQFARVKAKK